MSNEPDRPGAGDDDTPHGSGSGLPPELEQVLRGLTGGELDPQMLEMLKQMGIGAVDPTMLSMMAGQLRSMFMGAQDGAPLQPQAALDIARKTVAADPDPVISAEQSRAAADAVRVADLWLDQVTDVSHGGLTGRAWSRAEWVEATMPVWTELVTPVAAGVSAATQSAATRQLGRLRDDLGGEAPDAEALGLPPGLLPPGADLSQILDQMGPMMATMSSSMFSLQLGQAVGTLAADVLTGTEVGLPLVEHGDVVLMPRRVEAFAGDLALPAEEVRLYLAVREAARARLFAAIGWLGPQVLVAVQDYARGIDIDTDAIEASLAGMDMSDPAALQEALQDKLFKPTPSPGQAAALLRLESWLALIEGWVDVVSGAAAAAHLPHASALAEAVRRRRASGGPAEKTFAALVGLELRPRRLRDAANLFAALEARGGSALRDSAWSHPDVAPTAADLDDPLGYAERLEAGPDSGLDDELEKLLSQDPPGDAGDDRP